ncbi:hypothetical protein [Streptomyces sp. cg36]|uniref:hypothetical protein n=1 Tax=Streptomyces sp. cg36 TaxID=3238798 RepID=UPI0034E1C66A
MTHVPHHHGYRWTGPKQRFDEEGLRRPPHPNPPPPAAPNDMDAQRLVDRYRQVAAEFPVTDLPPMETAQWLAKSPAVIRGTWQEPKEAAKWLGLQLIEYAPRFLAERDRDTTRLTALVASAAERLVGGGDVALGFYLERPAYLSLALVTCSPNRAARDLGCPLQ